MVTEDTKEIMKLMEKIDRLQYENRILKEQNDKYISMFNKLDKVILKELV